MIYLIAFNYSDDYGDIHTVIDEDYGYYLTKEDAEAAVEKLDEPSRSKYTADLAKYEKDYKNYLADVEKARKLGSMSGAPYPYKPSKPLPHDVIEVGPGEEASA